MKNFLPFMEPVWRALSPWAYTLIRVATGAIFVPHGVQKLLNGSYALGALELVTGVLIVFGIEPRIGVYNTTKAAVAAFTQNLARDYAPDKVRVNAVCPGEIHTPMLEAGVRRSGRTIADLDRLVPFGRIGKPEEVAALVAFLASDEAAFICGSLVEITGAQAVA